MYKRNGGVLLHFHWFHHFIYKMNASIGNILKILNSFGIANLGNDEDGDKTIDNMFLYDVLIMNMCVPNQIDK